MTTVDLHTTRLTIRTFVPDDLREIHRILDLAFGDGTKGADPDALDERRSWLEWSILNQRWFPALHQPVFGERAVVVTETGALIGAVGLVPLVDVYDQIPELRRCDVASRWAHSEIGLFWAIDPAHQRRGYATEAGRALIDEAFGALRLGRILATTEHTNLASQAVMRRLGMRLTVNPRPDPPWLQVVGVLDRDNVGA